MIYLGLFKVMFYFPNGKSTMWGIYRDFFGGGHPFSNSKFTIDLLIKKCGFP